MVVAFTTYVGLAKPDEAELALNWTRVQDLQEDNNTIIENEVNVLYTPYSPTLTASTTPPSVGAGFISGEYRDLNGFVLGSFKAEFEAGMTAGTGVWGFALPFTADAAFHSVGSSLTATPGDNDIIGIAYMFDTSGVDSSGPAAIDVVTIAGVSYARLLLSAYAGKTQYAYQAGSPFTAAAGDKFTGTFGYKRT